jgi:hypothetical protein
LDEARRVRVPGDLSEEHPALLDPTLASDCLLLTFDPDGTVHSRFAEQSNPLSYKRAETSIRCYHLDKEDFKERRQILANRVEQLVANGDYYLHRVEQGEESARRSFDEVVKDLRAMMHEQAEYSMAVKEICRVHRNRAWVDALLSVY